MNLLRNPEIKRFCILYAFCTFTAVAGGWFISPLCGGYAGLLCLVLLAIFYFYTARRYEAVGRLNSRLDRILHGDDSMEMLAHEEGELAILGSEIYKMTVMLREQAELLSKDKTYLSRSIADISHQLRTPLTSIRMLLPRLQREQLTRGEKLGLLQDIDSQLSRIEWLISVLLKISQLESGTVSFRRDTIHVRELVARALEPLEISMELKDITVNLDLCGDPCFEGDLCWMAEAIGNLLKNSMEHTPPGKTITIRAASNPVCTDLTVSDSGNGFRPEDLPHLFERFYKGKDSISGNYGIGLALANMIVTGQNGTIQAINRPEGGAEFRMHFYREM